MTRLRPVPLARRPRITVVIPCYNYARYLPLAVRSVQTQDLVDVEIIIVDDCSTDESRSVAEALCADDPRIQLVAHEHNLGHIATYNDGLARAGGDYVVLLSADDLLAEGSLARSAALLDARPDVGLVYGYAADFSELPPPARTECSSWTVWAGHQWLARICARGMNIIVNPEAMLRTRLMKELVGYNERLPHAADMELWMRAAARANVGRVNGVDQAFYRVHATNMHTTTFAGLHTDMAERAKVFRSVLTDPAHPIPEPGRLLSRALHSIAVEGVRTACLAIDRGGSYGGAQAQSLADLALECDPRVRGSVHWRAYQRRLTGPAPALQVRTTALIDSLRWKIRWRRWRRFGT